MKARIRVSRAPGTGLTAGRDMSGIWPQIGPRPQGTCPCAPTTVSQLLSGTSWPEGGCWWPEEGVWGLRPQSCLQRSMAVPHRPLQDPIPTPPLPLAGGSVTSQVTMEQAHVRLPGTADLQGCHPPPAGTQSHPRVTPLWTSLSPPLASGSGHYRLCPDSSN